MRTFTLASLSCLLLVAACSSVPKAIRPVVEFQHKHPAEYKKYSYLNPVSLDTYRAIWGERAGSTSYILGETKRRFGHEKGVQEFVKTMLQREAEDRQRFLKFCGDMEEASSNGGSICQYEWSDGKTKEIGFLVLKSGEIILRESWVTDYLSDHKEQ